MKNEPCWRGTDGQRKSREAAGFNTTTARLVPSRDSKASDQPAGVRSCGWFAAMLPDVGAPPVQYYSILN